MVINSIQEKFSTLLNEIDIICKKNNLDYYISPALAAFCIEKNEMPVNINRIKVYMTVNDCLRFIDIIESERNPDRVVEHMGNSKYYSGYNVSYVDTTSTYINLNRGTDFSVHGFKVIIEMIRPDVNNKLAAVLESGWEYNGYRRIKRYKPRRVLSMAVVRCMMIIGRKRLSKALFSFFNRVYGTENIETERVFVRTFKRKRKYYNAEIFAEKDEIELYGNRYCVPENIEEYIAIYYKKRRKRAVHTNVLKNNIVAMPKVPYKEYLELLDKKGLPLKDLFRRRREIFLSNNLAKKHIKSRDRVWTVACRSGDRLRFLEEFQERKGQIDNLVANKDYEALNELFAEHEKVTKRYLKRGLGFCVSQEIFELQCELLKQKGQDTVVEKLKKLVPDEHKAPIKPI